MEKGGQKIKNKEDYKINEKNWTEKCWEEREKYKNKIIEKFYKINARHLLDIPYWPKKKKEKRKNQTYYINKPTYNQ